MVDRYIITVIPVLIGTGIPLFGPLEEDVHLELAATKSWPSGIAQYTYEVARGATAPD